MKIIIKSTQMELTPALKEYTEKKIGSLKKFVKKIESIEPVEVFVEIGRITKHHKSGNVFYAEATTRIKKKILRAEFIGSDLRACIDEIKDILRQNLQKHKEISLEKEKLQKK